MGFRCEKEDKENGSWESESGKFFFFSLAKGIMEKVTFELRDYYKCSMPKRGKTRAQRER